MGVVGTNTVWREGKHGFFVEATDITLDFCVGLVPAGKFTPTNPFPDALIGNADAGLRDSLCIRRAGDMWGFENPNKYKTVDFEQTRGLPKQVAGKYWVTE